MDRFRISSSSTLDLIIYDNPTSTVTIQLPSLLLYPDFSLTIYEDQITAILGHNGAGKTTLFNMLTGMTEITSGSATVFGLNVGDSADLREIRSMTGVCPQHDILFTVLTPREHLMFYARIRGINEDKLEEVVETTLKEVDLATKADCKADDLSGGQKRKLSIGIALIGDPRIIFLDEPTAGVDAFSRRRLWTLLKHRKQGKVILLTTHFMDEADVLADRKAIMTKGQLRCCGSSLFLKNKFGLGYHLTLIVGQDIPPAEVLELLRQEVPNVTLVRHYGKEMTFVLQDTPAHLFSGMFRLLEECRAAGAKVPIEDYGVSMTTLEEVFLALNTDENEEEAADGEKGDSDSNLESIDNLAQRLVKTKSGASSPLGASKSSLGRNSAVLNTNSERESPDVESRPLDASGPSMGLGGRVDDKKKGFAIEEVEVEYSAWRAFKALMLMRIVAVLREPLALIFLVGFPLGFTAGGIALIDSQGIQTPTETVMNFTSNLLLMGPNSLLVHNSTNHTLEGWIDLLIQTGLTSVSYNGTYEEIFDYRPQVAAVDVNVFPKFESQSAQQPLDVALYYNTSYRHSLPVLVNFISNAFVLQSVFALVMWLIQVLVKGCVCVH
ncbi:ABC transporter-like [Trinorchestia longiramus]|nr:ABC transporter-like [Trinorchestia longiramus]